MTQNRKPHSVIIRSTDLDRVDWSKLVKAIAREIADEHLRSIEKEQSSTNFDAD
jgi:hypothetical protein